MIDLGGLLDIEIQSDNTSAWLQGGVYRGQVTENLWEKGFVASKYYYFMSFKRTELIKLSYWKL